MKPTVASNVLATTKDPGEPSALWWRQAERWELPDDLEGGTPRMRATGRRWLPQEKGETDEAYTARLQRSFLRPFYSDSLDKLSSRPFAYRKVKVEWKQGAELDERLARIEKDADYEGTDLTQFARQVLREGIHRGAVGLMVDAPIDTADIRFSQEQALDVHPYFAMVSFADILGVKAYKGPDGRMAFGQLRVRERNVADESNAGGDPPDRVRIHDEGAIDESDAGRPVRGLARWSVWEKAKDSWVLVKSGKYSTSRIPFLVAYLNKVKFMEAAPCLDALAWLNAQHWQGSSDQENGLHFMRVPVWYEAGCDQNKVDEPLRIGSNRAIRNSQVGATLTVVETSGGALAEGWKQLQALEAAAEAMGVQPLVEGTAQMTATGHVLNESRSSCALQAWLVSIEALFVGAYVLAAELLSLHTKVELPPNFNVDIFSDFALPARASAENDFLLRTSQAGRLSTRTFLKEVKRRGTLPEELDIDAEVLAIHEEGPMPGLMSSDDPPADPPPGHNAA